MTEQRPSENLSDLSKIDINAILSILGEKFELSKYYTEASINTLIAINPFQDRPYLYSEEMMNFYNEFSDDISQLNNRPAHIYKLASKAWQVIKTNRKSKFDEATRNQTILVSGDSGSGKTRTINYIIKYYSFITQKDPANPKSAEIKNILLNTNVILESFGNSRTQLNDNSSRFGKYIKLYFSANTQELVSASLSTYLLEKTRSIETHNLNLNEKLNDFKNFKNYNFHIFYIILHGSSELERKNLLYINKKLLANFSLNSANEIENQNVKSSFQLKLSELKASFDLIDLKANEIFKLISAIAHLNSCQFDSQSTQLTEQSVDHFKYASALFNFNQSDLANYLFVHELSITSSRNDVIKKTCNLNQIKQRKNCLAKLVYNELFKYLVKKINEKLNSICLEHSKVHEEPSYIGLLDIYGFESIAESNSLEQLCINYANEKLQKIFIDSYFKLNKFEYENELPDELFHIEYNDNLPLLNLIESTNNSLFSLLNEQSILNNHDYLIKGNELLLKIKNTFASTTNTTNNNNNLIFQPKLNTKSVFIIKHYAGLVNYSTDDLISKNNDHVPDDLLKFLLKSKHSFLAEQILESYISKATLKNRKKLTVLSKFKKNLDTLISSLSKTNIFYVRCIKPNYNLQANYFDYSLVKNQLESCGILSLLNLSKQAFIHKYLYSHFAIKYKPILLFKKNLNINSLDPSQSELTRHILAVVTEDKALYKFGLTKVFLKESLLKQLEVELQESVNRCARKIQCKWKSYSARVDYLRKLNSIRVIQQWWMKIIRIKLFIKKKSYFDTDLCSLKTIDSVIFFNSSCSSISLEDLSWSYELGLNTTYVKKLNIELDLVEKKLSLKK